MINLSINKNIFLVVILFVSYFSCNANVLAADSEINAGILSNIWFSSLKIDRDQNVSIYGSFQNSEDSDLSGEASFLINENIIKTLDFDVASGKIIKLESPWKTEAGDFEIKIVINSLFQNGIEIEPHNLIESGTSTKIKITRKIDFEYITEVSAETFNNTVKAIDEIAENTSQKLEKAKTKDVSGSTSIGGNGEATSDSVGEVAGTQFSREESEGSLSVASSTSDGFFGTVKNIFIVILQSILKYWKLAFVILLALLMLWFIKKKD